MVSAEKLLPLSRFQDEPPSIAYTNHGQIEFNSLARIHSIRPYYETRANYNGVLKQQKVRIEDLDERVSAAKAAYNDALKRLEEISEEIHRLRKEREGSSGFQYDEDDDQSHNITSSEAQAGTSSREEDEPMNDLMKRFDGTGINSTDEYREFPQKLTTKSSPVRQNKVAELDCPHMYQDFKKCTGGQMVGLQLNCKMRTGFNFYLSHCRPTKQ